MIKKHMIVKEENVKQNEKQNRKEMILCVKKCK